LKELKLLDEDANVFKLIGPALVKQDLVEAKSNVTKRLEYIQAEIDRIETNIKAIELKQTEKQQEVCCAVYNALCTCHDERHAAGAEVAAEAAINAASVAAADSRIGAPKQCTFQLGQASHFPEAGGDRRAATRL
jgi:Prefoldin subunit